MWFGYRLVYKNNRPEIINKLLEYEKMNFSRSPP